MKTTQTTRTQTDARRATSRGFSIALPALAPRNPLVAAARGRKAGVHQPSAGAERQAAKRELRTLMRDA
jgi:hypothetical protein